MFDWDDVRFFLAVQRTKSLTAAGRLLDADQSTVGRRITAFEEKIGTKLFFRTPDGFMLSAHGERLLVRATLMEEEATAIGREIAGAEEQLSGTIRLTAPDMFSARILTPMLVAFRTRWPAIDLELVADNRILSLTKREADMAIRVGRPRDPGLVTRKLADFNQGLYAARSYIATYGMPRPDYAGHSVVGYDESARGQPDARWFAEHTKKARVAFRANTTMVQLAATLTGVGFTILPAYLGAVEPDLVEVLAPKKGQLSELWLAVHEDMRHAAKIRSLSEFLASEFTKLGPRLRGDNPKSSSKEKRASRGLGGR